MSKESPQFLMDANAMQQLLEALTGPLHYIREIQVTRGLGDNPIDLLLNQYNTQAKELLARRDKEASDVEPESAGAADTADQYLSLDEIYTCIGKGGRYELVSLARPAGELRNVIEPTDHQLVVYREGERHFVRTLKDFHQRMEKVAETESSAT